MGHPLYIGCRYTWTSVISSRVSLDPQSSPCNITRSTLKYLWKKKKKRICSTLSVPLSMRLIPFEEGISFCPMGDQVQIDIKRIVFLCFVNITYLIWHDSVTLSWYISVSKSISIVFALFHYRLISRGVTTSSLLSRIIFQISIPDARD